MPRKILPLFEWLLDRYLEACGVEIVLLTGAHSAERYVRVRPQAAAFGIEGKPSMFENEVHGFAECSDSVIVRVASDARRAVSQRLVKSSDPPESMVSA